MRSDRRPLYNLDESDDEADSVQGYEPTTQEKPERIVRPDALQKKYQPLHVMTNQIAWILQGSVTRFTMRAQFYEVMSFTRMKLTYDKKKQYEYKFPSSKDGDDSIAGEILDSLPKVSETETDPAVPANSEKDSSRVAQVVCGPIGTCYVFSGRNSRCGNG
ncbi:hypothetical protein BVC80_1797g33 [Macleaya cordata]|uniref:Uncharacterized protein n=1 Tax=Macleaya cordata TaxID=56857 RepID=A0A200PT25_MACCD|nr:hypothetical protein BVC80_1797g33 [Macleaya cordata]